MAKRSNIRRWLAPAARQLDGSLWPPDLPSEAPASKVTPRTQTVAPVRLVPWHRRRTADSDPFTPAERAFLRGRLLVLERNRGGLDDGLRVAAAARPTPRVTPALKSMDDRGLLEVALVDAEGKARFTAAGRAALRAYIEWQSSNFHILYPRHCRELGLGSGSSAGW